MITRTANFIAASQQKSLKPIYRFSINGYSKVFVWRADPAAPGTPWIVSIGDWSVSVDTLEGSYTIDNLVVTVINPAGAVTTDTSTQLLEQRFCTLQMGFEGLALSDYCTLFSGIVNDIAFNTDGSYSFTCNDYNRLTQRVVYLYGDDTTVTTTTQSYAGSNPWSTVTQTWTTDPVTGVVTPSAVITYAASGPSGPAGTVVSGNTTTVTTSRTVLIGGTSTTIYEQTVTTVGTGTRTVTITTYGSALLYGNVIITVLTDASTGLKTTTLSTTFTENGVDGSVSSVTDYGLISSSNYRHVVGHPLDIMLDIFLNEIGMASSDVNQAQVELIRDTILAGCEFEFFVTGSVDAKDFIENQLLKPLAGYLYINAAGQICVGFAQPVPNGNTPVTALTPSNMQSVPALTTHPLISVVTSRFDKDDFNEATISNSNGYLAQATTIYAPSVADLPAMNESLAEELVANSGAVQGQTILESDGMRSGFQGFLLSTMVAQALFAMYGSYNPTLEVPCHWADTFFVELAEYVTLTHPLLPNRKTGTMGIVTQQFKVVKRSYSFADMTVTLTLEDASGLTSFNAKRIAPTGKGVYTAVSSADQQRYLFMADDTTGKQSNGDAAGTVG
jgi:hypothetical protein